MRESLHKLIDSLDGPAILTAVLVWGGRLLIGVAILLVGWWLARRIAGGARRVLLRGGADPLLGDFLRTVVLVLLIAVVIISALGSVGIPTTSLLTALGAAGLAIGLALQGSLSNLAAGVLLILFRPFRVGEYVELDGVAGKVQSVSLMHTTLLTLDNREVILPNAKVSGNVIVNVNARGTRRVDLVIGIGYGDDIAKAIRVVHEVIAAEPRVLADPAPTVVVMALADSSVNLAVRPWANSGDVWGVQTSLLQAIKERFDAEGISIPFPQQEIVVRRPSPAATADAASKQPARAAAP